MFLNETHNCKSFPNAHNSFKKKNVKAYSNLSNPYITPIYSFYEKYHQG
jgi:hypothetical protein